MIVGKLRKSLLRNWLAAGLALMAVALFAMPQGICPKAMLSNSDCCCPALDMAGSACETKACCKAHAPKEKQTSDTAPASKDGCPSISSDPYLPVDGQSAGHAVVLAPVMLAWLSQPEVESGVASLAPNAAVTEAAPPALRRGSSILRI